MHAQFEKTWRVEAAVVDTVITNGKLVTPYEIFEAGIAIDDGKITAVAKPIRLPKAKRTINANGNFILPGAIDTHCHIYDPDYTHREDFTTGTEAAAAGGVTTIIDMPLRKPVLQELIKEKVKIGEQKSLVDFSFHSGMIVRENMHEIPNITELGVRSFKIFTCSPFKVDEETIIQVMKTVSKNNGVIVAHAENDEIVTQWTNTLREQGRNDPMAYIESRPNRAEQEAVNSVITLAGQTRVQYHIAHLTTRQGVESSKKAKADGQEITAETCPHYLIFTKHNIKKLGPYLKMAPPLREKTDVQALWQGLKQGFVDIVATDHAPGTRDEKEIGWKNIWEAPGGIPGVETMLPLMISEGVNKGLISMQDLCRILCEKPAKIFHLYPKKGGLLTGSDADIVIVDLKKETLVRSDRLHYKVGWTPYEGMRLRGYPILTMLRGEVIAENGQIIGNPGYGSFVPMSSKWIPI